MPRLWPHEEDVTVNELATLLSGHNDLAVHLITLRSPTVVGQMLLDAATRVAPRLPVQSVRALHRAVAPMPGLRTTLKGLLGLLT